MVPVSSLSNLTLEKLLLLLALAFSFALLTPATAQVPAKNCPPPAILPSYTTSISRYPTSVATQTLTTTINNVPSPYTRVVTRTITKSELWTVTSDPVGVPTLLYNCAKMPNICANLDTYPPASIRKSGSVWSIDNPSGEIALHFDKDADRKENRRKLTCPNKADGSMYGGSWHNRNSCPKGLRAPVVQGTGSHVDLNGNPIVPAIWGYRLRPGAGVTFVDTARNAIADGANNFRGLLWSCEEFPPATNIEGGEGARTGCAPHKRGPLPDTLPRPVLPLQQSEQNWQSSAHNYLRRIVRSDGRAVDGVYLFKFRVEYDASPQAGATTLFFYQRANRATRQWGPGRREEAYSADRFVKVAKALYHHPHEAKHHWRAVNHALLHLSSDAGSMLNKAPRPDDSQISTMPLTSLSNSSALKLFQTPHDPHPRSVPWWGPNATLSSLSDQRWNYSYPLGLSPNLFPTMCTTTETEIMIVTVTQTLASNVSGSEVPPDHLSSSEGIANSTNGISTTDTITSTPGTVSSASGTMPSASDTVPSTLTAVFSSVIVAPTTRTSSAAEVTTGIVPLNTSTFSSEDRSETISSSLPLPSGSENGASHFCSLFPYDTLCPDLPPDDEDGSGHFCSSFPALCPPFPPGDGNSFVYFCSIFPYHTLCPPSSGEDGGDDGGAQLDRCLFPAFCDSSGPELNPGLELPPIPGPPPVPGGGLPPPGGGSPPPDPPPPGPPPPSPGLSNLGTQITNTPQEMPSGQVSSSPNESDPSLTTQRTTPVSTASSAQLTCTGDPDDGGDDCDDGDGHDDDCDDSSSSNGPAELKTNQATTLQLSNQPGSVVSSFTTTAQISTSTLTTESITLSSVTSSSTTTLPTSEDSDSEDTAAVRGTRTAVSTTVSVQTSTIIVFSRITDSDSKGVSILGPFTDVSTLVISPPIIVPETITETLLGTFTEITETVTLVEGTPATSKVITETITMAVAAGEVRPYTTTFPPAPEVTQSPFTVTLMTGTPASLTTITTLITVPFNNDIHTITRTAGPAVSSTDNVPQFISDQASTMSQQTLPPSEPDKVSCSVARGLLDPLRIENFPPQAQEFCDKLSAAEELKSWNGEFFIGQVIIDECYQANFHAYKTPGCDSHVFGENCPEAFTKIFRRCILGNMQDGCYNYVLNLYPRPPAEGRC
ncbi:hypothetical protein H2200_000513 [Cladophialophora chaetospira]|uniref:Uncharacterized protein n=1 Tax=Cladophialophora chaetospira TaxID=386627 RepID=A0AA39CP91_9EURO|nr:hypothetical protein H2200_000513 [Cladophialophora chaetospira]